MVRSLPEPFALYVVNVRDGEQMLTIGNVKQWVRIAGAQHATVPLLCLHGGPGGNHWVFERTAGLGLEARRTVIYHEQRGSGRSSPPQTPDTYSMPLLVQDVEALMDKLELSSVDLLGYSFGGGLALEVARALPARVRRVVAQAPAFALSDPDIVRSQLGGFLQVAAGDVRTAIQTIIAGPLPAAAQLEQIWETVDTATIDRFLFQRADLAAHNRRLWQESGLNNSGDMARALAAQPISDTPAHLNEIQARALVLAGRHDRNVPLSGLEALAAALPHAQLHIFEDSAHFPDVEETEAYVAAVLAFLESK